MFFFGSLTFKLLCILIALLVAILFYKWIFGYCQNRSVENIKSSIPFSNIGDLLLLKRSFGEFWRDIYLQFKKKKIKLEGVFLFTQENYMLLDLDLIKHILQNDFSHFVNHGFYVNERDDPLTGHLFLLEDTKWRNLRNKLSPTFTSSKMKMMFPTIINCTKGLIEILDENADNEDPVDIKTVLQRFTMDIIGSCAFGIECNCVKDSNSEFIKYGKKVFASDIKNILKFLISVAVPRRILYLLKYKIFDPEVSRFFLNLVNAVVKHREESNIFRRDFMHLLLQLKNRGNLADDENLFGEGGGEGYMNLTINELAAQVFVFFVGGFETSSTTMTFAIFELARNQTIQEKARQEVLEILKKHKELTYDSTMDLKYIDMILLETLRKHPPVPLLQRECNKDYKVPGTNIYIKRGKKVIISILGIHHDEEYYPEPEKFDPERFNEENKAKRPHCSWLPFGEGPRMCIGLRFGLLQSKVGLATLLSKYKITLNDKTKLPLQIDKKSLVLSIEGDLWVNITKI